MGDLLSTTREEDRTFTDDVENKKVAKIEKMSVPMDSAMGLLPHQGVKVTTTDGDEYMVHKVGKRKQGHESTTAVWSMSDERLDADKWYSSGSGSISVEDRNLKIGHFVEQSGEGYNLVFENCWNATERMMDLAKPKGLKLFEQKRRDSELADVIGSC